MRVIGIDPGTLTLGYGVVEEGAGSVTLITCGVIKLNSRHSIEKRLSSLYKNLQEIFISYKPEQAALEEPFVSDNVRSAMALGRAQAIAMLAAQTNSCDVFRYLPTQVKQQVAGYGGSDKIQVMEMVRLQLGLQAFNHPHDAADALAVAICHIHMSRMQSLINNTSGAK